MTDLPAFTLEMLEDMLALEVDAVTNDEWLTGKAAVVQRAGRGRPYGGFKRRCRVTWPPDGRTSSIRRRYSRR